MQIYASAGELAAAAASMAREHLEETLACQQAAAVILATGNSQIQFLEALAAAGGVDWSRVTLFHMDEYLGIDAKHPASFRRFLRERVEARLHPGHFHYLEGDALLPVAECERYSALLRQQPIDLCCLGIGENGHLAFNDPQLSLAQLKEAARKAAIDEEILQMPMGYETRLAEGGAGLSGGQRQ